MRIQPISSSWWCTAPVPQTYLDIGRPREEHGGIANVFLLPTGYPAVALSALALLFAFT